MPVFVGVRLKCDTCDATYPYDYVAPGKPWLEMMEEAKIQAGHAGWQIDGSLEQGTLLDIRCLGCQPKRAWIAPSFEDRVLDALKEILQRLDGRPGELAAVGDAELARMRSRGHWDTGKRAETGEVLMNDPSTVPKE